MTVALESNRGYWVMKGLNLRPGQHTTVRLGGPELFKTGEQEIFCRVTGAHQGIITGIAELDDGQKCAFKITPAANGQPGILRLSS